MSLKNNLIASSVALLSPMALNGLSFVEHTQPEGLELIGCMESNTLPRQHTRKAISQNLGETLKSVEGSKTEEVIEELDSLLLDKFSQIRRDLIAIRNSQLQTSLIGLTNVSNEKVAKQKRKVCSELRGVFSEKNQVSDRDSVGVDYSAPDWTHRLRATKNESALQEAKELVDEADQPQVVKQESAAAKDSQAEVKVTPTRRPRRSRSQPATETRCPSNFNGIKKLPRNNKLVEGARQYHETRRKETKMCITDTFRKMHQDMEEMKELRSRSRKVSIPIPQIRKVSSN